MSDLPQKSVTPESMDSADFRLRVISILERASFLIDTHKYQDTVSMLEPLIEESRQLDFKDYIHRALGMLGIAHYELNQLKDARICFEESLSLARKDGETYSIATDLSELSMIAHKEGDLEQAISLCQESIDLELELGRENSVALHNLAVLYQENGRFEEAKMILEIVQESCEARLDLEALGKVLNEQGLVYMELGDIAKAIACFLESLQLKHLIANKYGRQVTLNNLIRCLRLHPEAMSDPQVRQALKNWTG